MILRTLLITGFLALLALAITYFYARVKPFSITLLVFYVCNGLLSSSFFYNTHVIFFYIIMIFFVAFPVVCLIIFALDTHYALFCTDASFLVVFVWLFIFLFFLINLIAFAMRIIYV